MLTLCADVTLSQATGASHAVSGWRLTAKKSSDLEKKKRSSVNRYQCQPQHFASTRMIKFYRLLSFKFQLKHIFINKPF
jgi:hypothetical protein